MSVLRHAPTGLTRQLARLPVWLYRARLGWLLGGHFLLLSHTGRKSGRIRSTVLEVVRYDRDSGVLFVAAAWGERAEWFRNIRKDPAVAVVVGRERFTATAERLSPDAAEAVFRDYARRHRFAMRALARVLGSDDPSTLARAIPVIALRRRG